MKFTCIQQQQQQQRREYESLNQNHQNPNQPACDSFRERVRSCNRKRGEEGCLLGRRRDIGVMGEGQEVGVGRLFTVSSDSIVTRPPN